MTDSPEQLYTISGDGHVVGHDGFIVPASFEEFSHRYPRYISHWLHRYMPDANPVDAQMREAELTAHLATVPPFNPKKAGGASAPRFFAFVNGRLLDGLEEIESTCKVKCTEEQK